MRLLNGEAAARVDRAAATLRALVDEQS